MPSFLLPQLNGGTYKLMYDKDSKISVYYYHFPTTVPAKHASADNLEVLRLHTGRDDTTSAGVDEILPSCEILFDSFVIPREFCTRHETLSFRTFWRQEGRQEGRLEVFEVLRAKVDDNVLTCVKEQCQEVKL